MAMRAASLSTCGCALSKTTPSDRKPTFMPAIGHIIRGCHPKNSEVWQAAGSQLSSFQPPSLTTFIFHHHHQISSTFIFIIIIRFHQCSSFIVIIISFFIIFSHHHQLSSSAAGLQLSSLSNPIGDRGTSSTFYRPSRMPSLDAQTAEIHFYRCIVRGSLPQRDKSRPVIYFTTHIIFMRQIGLTRNSRFSNAPSIPVPIHLHLTRPCKLLT